MKLLLLKILLQRRARDEGFTLPMVIAVGLIMVLLAMVNILSAGEENLSSISDNQKNRSIAIAEAGVAKYRELLDKNRLLTVYNRAEWASVTNTCDINTIITNFADTTQWHDVNDGSGVIGQYRIISYVYDIDANTATNDNNQFAPNDDNFNTTDLLAFNNNANYNPKGILTIKSRTGTSNIGGSETQVQAEIPIRINSSDMDNLFPALWIGDSSITNLGTGSFKLDGNRNGVANGTASNNNGDGNIVISKPASGATPGCDAPGVLNSNRVVYDPRPLPTIINSANVTTINSVNIVPTIDTDLRTKEFRGQSGLKERMLLLGTKQDPVLTPALHAKWKTDANGFDYFFYKAPSGFTINDKQKLGVDGQSRVVLYVEDNIYLNGEASLQAGSDFNRNFNSTGLQVYVDGTKNININPGGKTVRIKGLIHAPQSTINITGAGNVVIEGAVWVKNWNNTGNANVTIIPDSVRVNSNKAYQHYIGTDNRAAKPITGAPTDWEIQEAVAN